MHTSKAYHSRLQNALRMPLLVWTLAWTCLQAAGQDVLSQPVPHFRLEGVSLEEALYRLMDEAQVSISFHNADIPSKQVQMDMRGANVGQVLRALLQDTRLQIELIGEQIALVPRPDPPHTHWHTISGYVQDRKSGEHLTGAYVYDPQRQLGTETNEYGYFSLRLPEGHTSLIVSYLGYQSERIAVALYQSRRLDVMLEPSLTLRQIVITARDSLGGHLRRPEHAIEPHLLRALPSMGGEPDVVRATHLLPGVQTGADGADGIHVRGGNYEQNLVLLDGVPLYNPFHAFGAFSIFNTPAIKQATFIKSGFPARYAGRLSSVLDVRTREGNLLQWQGSAALSNIAVKAWIDGPIVPERTALFLSGRTSLLGLLLKPVSRQRKARQSYQDKARYYSQSGETTLQFDDFNVKLHHRFGPNDHLFLSYYRSTDRFRDQTYGVLDEKYVDTLNATTYIFRDSSQYDDQLNWSTMMASARWNHIFNKQLFANTTLFWARYRQQTTNLTYISERVVQPIQGTFQRRLALLQSGSLIDDLGLRTDIDLLPGGKHRYRFGFSLTHHTLKPQANASELSGEFIGVPIDETSSDTLPTITSVESGLWLEDIFQLSQKWRLHWGIHFSSFFVEKKRYHDLQPRLSLQFAPSPRWQLHFDLTRMAQYLHLLRTSNITFPNDLWVTATADFGPQRAIQTSAGFSRALGERWQLSVDGYHNWMSGLLTLQEGGSLLAWRTATATGRGNSFGLEFLLRRHKGALTGWLAYTWSRTTRHFDQYVNFGEPFPFRYDRRHDLKVVVVWAVTDRLESSATWTYGTGLAVSLPLSRYTVTMSGFVSSVQAYVIDGKNSERLPPYHRLDLNLSYLLNKGSLKHTLKLGIYNAYNQINPLYYAVRTEFTGTAGIDRKEVNKLTQVALIPALPYLNYTISW